MDPIKSIDVSQAFVALVPLVGSCTSLSVPSEYTLSWVDMKGQQNAELLVPFVGEGVEVHQVEQQCDGGPWATTSSNAVSSTDEGAAGLLGDVLANAVVKVRCTAGSLRVNGTITVTAWQSPATSSAQSYRLPTVIQGSGSPSRDRELVRTMTFPLSVGSNICS